MYDTEIKKDPLPPNDWMSPLNKITFRNAFLKKLPQVTISGDRTFNLYYDRKPGKVLVHPAWGDLVPMGWFDLKTVRHPTWLES